MSVVFLLLGVVLGAAAVSRLDAPQKRSLVSFVDQYIRAYDSKTTTPLDAKSLHAARSIAVSQATYLRRTVVSEGKALLLAYVLGLTIVGAPLVLVVLAAKGFMVGFTVGFLVDEYVARGVLFSVAAVLPHNLILVPAVMALAVNALRFSWDTVRGPTRTGPPLYQRFVSYSAVSLALGAVILVGSAVQVWVTPLFIRVVTRYL